VTPGMPGSFLRGGCNGSGATELRSDDDDQWGGGPTAAEMSSTPDRRPASERELGCGKGTLAYRLASEAHAREGSTSSV
jgi:hypothetical protein